MRGTESFFGLSHDSRASAPCETNAFRDFFQSSVDPIDSTIDRSRAIESTFVAFRVVAVVASERTTTNGDSIDRLFVVRRDRNARAREERTDARTTRSCGRSP